MNNQRHQQAVNRVAARHLGSSPDDRHFVQLVEAALTKLKDAIDISELRSSDSFEAGAALADWNGHVATANNLIRTFSAKIDPLLRKILRATRSADMRLAEYPSEADQFAAALKKQWRTVRYNPNTGQGSADMGGFEITFHESGSDSAVVVNFTRMPRMKGSPETVLDVLEDLRKFWMRVG